MFAYLDIWRYGKFRRRGYLGAEVKELKAYLDRLPAHLNVNRVAVKDINLS